MKNKNTKCSGMRIVNTKFSSMRKKNTKSGGMRIVNTKFSSMRKKYKIRWNNKRKTEIQNIVA